MALIKFGTDGWRAIIAEDFTFDNVRIVAQAVANYLQDLGQAPRGLVVGYDTRFGSENFAASVAEVLAGNGIKCYLCDRAAPTQAVSFSILQYKAGGAAVITASHNPAIWNGFKYKPEYAGSASPEVVTDLEQRIADIQLTQDVKRTKLEVAIADGLVQQFDPRPAYYQQLGKLVDVENLKNAGLNIVYDAMFGAGAGYFQDLLGGGKTVVTGINQERNPIFPGIRPEPIAPNLHASMNLVKELGSDLGIATDGDADRVGIIDEKGRFVTQLQVFGLLALYALEVKGWRGPLVKSLSTTSMVDKLGEMYGVPVHETSVGFKYIGPKMMSENAIVGGEESGGFGFRGHIPERDGVLAGLMIADMVVRLGRRPAELVEYLYSKVGPHYYDRVDLEFPAEQRAVIMKRLIDNQPTEIEGVQVAQAKTDDGFKYILTDGSWLLIRFSGTEPIMRVYAETDSLKRVLSMLKFGRQLAGV
jgi:alpha-D-glucose phosphate-specific phosphoglucomutase